RGTVILTKVTNCRRPPDGKPAAPDPKGPDPAFPRNVCPWPECLRLQRTGARPSTRRKAVTEGKTPKRSRARTRVLRLPATLGIAQLAELHPQFDQALEKGGTLALDGSAVEQLDGAALQWLLAFQRAATEAGH